MMLACSVAFILLNYLGVARTFYSNLSSSGGQTGAENAGCSYSSMELQNSNESSPGIDPSVAVKPDDIDKAELKDPDKTGENLRLPQDNAPAPTLTVKNYIYLLSIIAFTNALSNGVLPAVSSYSSLPYGPMTYHLSASLGNMANPVACIIAVFLPMRSFWGIGGCTVLATGMCIGLHFLNLFIRYRYFEHVYRFAFCKIIYSLPVIYEHAFVQKWLTCARLPFHDTLMQKNRSWLVCNGKR